MIGLYLREQEQWFSVGLIKLLDYIFDNDNLSDVICISEKEFSTCYFVSSIVSLESLFFKSNAA